MIKTHKNIRNVIGELISSEDYNINLLDVLNKNSSINYDELLKHLPKVFEKDIKKAPDSIPDSSPKIYRNLGLNKSYSFLVEKLLSNNGEFITEMRLYKYLEAVIINTQFLLNLTFKISFLTQKKGLSKRTYLIAKAPFYFPDAVRQEARVYVRKNALELYEIEDGEKIEDYQSNSEIMNQAREQLITNMDSAIRKTLLEFHDLKDNLNYNSNILKQYKEMFDKLEKIKN
jgi:hypothetical protein